MGHLVVYYYHCVVAVWTNYCLFALIFYNSIYLYVYFSILGLVVFLWLIPPPPEFGVYCPNI
jgi:hypothetical protein